MTAPSQSAELLAHLAAAINRDPAPRHTQAAWELAVTLASQATASVTYRPINSTGRLAVPAIRHLLPRPVNLTGIVHHLRRPFLVQLRLVGRHIVVPAGWVTSADPDVPLDTGWSPGPARRPALGNPTLSPDLRDQLAAMLTDQVRARLHHHGADIAALEQLLRTPTDTPRPGQRLSLPCGAILTGIAGNDLALLVAHGVLGADPHPMAGLDVDLLDLLALARSARRHTTPDALSCPRDGVPEVADQASPADQLSEMCTPQAWLAGYGREYVRACLENLPGPHAWGRELAVRHAAKAAAIEGLLTLEHDAPAGRHALYRAVSRHRDFLADEVQFRQHTGTIRAVEIGVRELGDANILSHIEVAGHWLAAELATAPGVPCVIARRLSESATGASLLAIREVIDCLDIAVYDVA